MCKILDYNKIYSHSVRRKIYLLSRSQRIWRLKKNWYDQVFEQNKKNDSPVYIRVREIAYGFGGPSEKNVSPH
jgi:hypothetical protein